MARWRFPTRPGGYRSQRRSDAIASDFAEDGCTSPMTDAAYGSVDGLSVN